MHSLAFSQPGATLRTPPRPEILVYRIARQEAGFLVGLAGALHQPEVRTRVSVLLLQIHPEVKLGWHMNKQHWKKHRPEEGSV